MAISTDLDVANLALGQLGVSAIASLAAGDYAGVDQDSYDAVIGDLFERHDWKFLQTYAQLTEAAAPPAQWQKAFDLPADIIGAPLAVYPGSGVGQSPTTRYARIGAQILTDHPTIWVLYAQAKAPSLWPSAFTLLARDALAADWAIPITEMRSKRETFEVAAFGTPSEGGRGGRFKRAVNADVWSDPSISLLQFQDPIADARWGETRRYTDFQW